MTQQEISTYFRDAGYTENPEYTFVDPTGQFTFISGPEQLVCNCTLCQSTVMNQFILNTDYLMNWISVSIKNCQDN